MEYTNMSFLYDFAFMSLLLIIAQFLRSRIKFLQMFYIPASVLAGLMGLVLGPQLCLYAGMCIIWRFVPGEKR